MLELDWLFQLGIFVKLSCLHFFFEQVLTVNNILWRHLLKHFRNVFAAIVKRVLQAYGGNSVAVRIYRTYFEARTSLADMWKGNPVLTTVLFGLPLGFLSLILYSICCSDILDAEEDEEEGRDFTG